MSLTKQIIEASLRKKPIDIKEAVEVILVEKARGLIDTIKPEFGNAVMEDFETDIELQEFFAQFHADHGDKPLEEQLEIMEAFEADVELQEFFAQFHTDHGDKPLEEQLEIMEAFEADMSE